MGGLRMVGYFLSIAHTAQTFDEVAIEGNFKTTIKGRENKYH